MKLLSLKRLKHIKLADLINPIIERFVWSAVLDDKVCLLSDSLILTDKGEVQIKDINIGDKVLCTEGFQPVIAKRKIIKQKYLKIYLSDGRILKVTPDHKIFRKGYKYSKAKDLKVCDKLVGVSKCNFCNSFFIVTTNKNKFCSVECYRNFQKSGKYVILKNRTGSMGECLICKNLFYKGRKSNRKFCSRYCYLEFHSEFIEGKYCEVCNNIFTVGKSSKMKNKHFFCSRKCYLLFKGNNYEYHRYIQEHRITKINKNCKFCNNVFINYERRKFCSQKCYWSWLMNNSDGCYSDWRKCIFYRDNYRCQKCGKKEYLNAHHIKMKSLYPELKYDINNGITLCVDCHAEEHKKQPILVNFILNQKDRLYERNIY